MARGKPFLQLLPNHQRSPSLVVAMIVVMANERSDVAFKIAWKEVALQQDAVLECLMPAFNLALGLRMIGGTACVRHALVFQIIGQLPRHIAGAIVREQPWSMYDMSLIKHCRLQSQVQRILNVGSGHARAKLPSDDIAGVIIQDSRQVEPAPADHLQIHEVSLPELMYRSRFFPELIGSLHHNEGGARDQVMCFQQPVNTRLRDEVNCAHL